ncbi:TetR/AcrR family transcriptional regulator [Streptomyces sp. NPDC058665]|uniref:TetR/AcrR family transcriptional regulator n=1 Tax=Streptomyces sp. NPDC058665 TaxID=3346586 RepID=UPI00364CDBD0
MPREQRGARARQRERTRQTLLREGRRLFAEVGYGAVSLTEIVAAAGVTKGALYHHFDSKTALFRAVLRDLQKEVGDRVAEAAGARDDSWDQLVAGCQEFITATTAPDIQRIMLVDGPAVLGWTEWREMDEASSARHLQEALTALVAEGAIAAQPVAPLAHLLSGAMNEAALWLATSEDPADLADTRAALGRLLGALRVE